ncbi:unnamed protein product [Rotaria sordida]|uniref:Amidohydrolase-related domain-containing protein n=1 Tax=Rotaria sordida TaxID=392033 RepID=A0A814C6L5_9BILA|nr:unnamed protein product [Rotaria sordida]
MPELFNIVILHDQNLDVRLCKRFAWDEISGRITSIEFADNKDYNKIFANTLTKHVLIPAFVNGHTHIGDSCLPDGATGLTLEQGFFRPHGFKYVELAKQSKQQLIDSMCDTMKYMLSTGTIMHWDFREQGIDGLHLIRQAEKQAMGIKSIVLSQFDQSPFVDLTDSSQVLPEKSKSELETLWNLKDNEAAADGFSESTMNDLTDRAWITIREMSKQYNNKLRAIHCLESDSYRSVSLARTGGRQSDLQRAFELYDPDIVVHLTEATQEDIDVIIQQQRSDDCLRSRIFVVCPRANATLGLKLPPIHALLTKGINLMLGTDNVMLNQPNMLAEMDFAYRLCKSQSGDNTHDPKAILSMATTINSYPTIYGKNEKGGIYENGPADFVLLDFSAKHLARTRNLMATIVTRLDPRYILATVHKGQTMFGMLP